MDENVIYGRFNQTSAGIGARLNTIMEKHDKTQNSFMDFDPYANISRNGPEFTPDHWSRRYMILGDIASALDSMECIMPIMTDTDYVKTEAYISKMLRLFIQNMLEETARRKKRQEAQKGT